MGFGSKLSTKVVTQTPQKYNEMIGNYDVYIDRSRYEAVLNKPIPVSPFSWGAGSKGITVLSMGFPSVLQNLNSLVDLPFTYSALYHLKAKIVIHLSGTPMHAGVLIAAVCPRQDLTNMNNINNLMCAPHAFIYANQASSVEVEIPFYNPTKYKHCCYDGNDNVWQDLSLPGLNDQDYAVIRLVVLNELATASGGSNLNGTIEIVIEDAIFKVPTNNQATYTTQLTLQSMSMPDVKTYSTVKHESMNETPYQRSAVPSVVKPKKEQRKSKFSQAIDHAFGYGKTLTTDLLDIGRDYIYRWTGLHSKNLPALSMHMYGQSRNNPNIVDGEVTYERMDPYVDYKRITDDFYFNTDVDEMDIYHLMSKPQYVTTFTISDDSRGTVVFSRPIQPNMAINIDGYFDSIHTKLALSALAWSGPMELIIQSSMTNFQQCKLVASLQYATRTSAITLVPNMNDVLACPTTVMEFGGGGTIQCVDLPYFYPGKHCPISNDGKVMPILNGMIYLYVLEPLVSSANSPTGASFNVYLRAKQGFNLYGYGARLFNKNIVITPADDNVVDQLELQSANLSEFQNVTSQECVLEEEENNSPPPVGGIRPLVSVRDLYRRMYGVYNNYYTLAATAPSYVDVDLASLLGAANINSLGLIADIYYGWRVGFRVKVELGAVTDARLMYIPPSLYKINSLNHFGATVLNPNDTTLQPYLQDATTILGQEVSYPGMYIDHSNYHTVGYSTGVKSFLGRNSTTVVPTAQTVIEGEIPFMHPNDFAVNYTTGQTTPFVSNLGIMRVSFVPQAPTETSAAVVNMKIFLSLDDEARTGFQCQSQSARLACKSVAPFNVVSAFNSPQYTPSANPATDAPNAFISQVAT